MSIFELENELSGKLRAWFGLRQGLKSGEIKDSHKCREAKLAIAQIKTIMAEKQLGKAKK
ncbi:MAG: 50S ribosomal protein L29 [Patescibacteria group bacterium]|nr:50S ribosomal protein L29 [Patescibacteria group bacterium]